MIIIICDLYKHSRICLGMRSKIQKSLNLRDTSLGCLVVDDDAVFLELMVAYVMKHPQLHLAGACDGADEARGILESSSIDLLLLDINMPGISGFELLNSARFIPQVIFVTAHREYAVEAFEYDVTDYLVKPLTFDRFEEAIRKAMKIHGYQSLEAEEENLLVRVNSKLLKIACRNISHIEACGDYVQINERENTHLVLSTLNDMQNTLNPKAFMRVHRKYIVQLDFIDAVKGNTVIMENGMTVQVSRSLRQNLLSSLSTNKR